MRAPFIVSIIAVGVAVAGALTACGSDEAVFVDARAVDAAQLDGAACAGLDLAACRTTAGCVADLCPGCACDLSYRGCLGVGVVPAACPELGCPTQECCRAPGDCGTGSCVAPGTPTCGGACNPQPDECDVDGDCQPTNSGVGAVLICQPVPCACSGGTSACVPGCTTTDDCGEGETCDPARGRCERIRCPAGEECPLDFECNDALCVRRGCTTDVDCDSFCVDGACHGSLGVCQVPAP